MSLELQKGEKKASSSGMGEELVTQPATRVQKGVGDSGGFRAGSLNVSVT